MVDTEMKLDFYLEAMLMLARIHESRPALTGPTQCGYRKYTHLLIVPGHVPVSCNFVSVDRAEA